jgi:hypothetical protein
VIPTKAANPQQILTAQISVVTFGLFCGFKDSAAPAEHPINFCSNLIL